MSIHLTKEISMLKQYVLQLCTMVEENVRRAVEAVNNKDVEKARSVIQMDIEIDRFEIDVEEECLKILALHQPVANDLRYVIACLKMNNDLERIGDLAVNIAKKAIATASVKDDKSGIDFQKMSETTQQMLKKTLDALIENSSEYASQVLVEDDILDDMNKEMQRELLSLMKSDPERLEYYLNLLAVSRHLERIGDYATNIAEDIIYMERGMIVRHRTPDSNFEKFKKSLPKH